jgi:hypothetical protein
VHRHFGGFIGTSHWWIIAASFWLAAPCIICAMLLPAVALHFFLVFPKPWPILLKYPTASLVALYAVPIAATAGMLSLLGWCGWLNWRDYALVDVEQTRIALQWVRYGVYGYLTIASIYFVAAFAVLHRSLGAAQNFLEYVASIAVVGRTVGVSAWHGLGLAMFRPTEFALDDWGAGSRSFWRPLYVGLHRRHCHYRLMLVDQIVSKECSITFSARGSLSSSASRWSAACSAKVLQHFAGNQHIAITLVLLVVAILLWLRDMFRASSSPLLP